jgi:NTP pyrophosphatase (non-canonical NTP hydrolase)
MIEHNSEIVSRLINELAEDINNLAVSKGWHRTLPEEKDYIPTAIANLHGECSELWEAYRNKQLRNPCDKADKMKAAGLPEMTCLEEEVADIMIRCMDMAIRLNVNIGKAIINKHKFNATRPDRHGGKLA